MDKLAAEALEKPPENVDLELDSMLTVSGARLSKVTQALAYMAIRDMKSGWKRQRGKECHTILSMQWTALKRYLEKGQYKK